MSEEKERERESENVLNGLGEDSRGHGGLNVGRLVGSRAGADGLIFVENGFLGGNDPAGGHFCLG